MVLLSTEVSLFIVVKRIRIIMDTTTITATAITILVVLLLSFVSIEFVFKN